MWFSVRVWRRTAFDLTVWSFFPFTSCFLHPTPPSSTQLYHVIRMNLHRDSPIWRRQGFRKCLKMTQQQQAEFPCLRELHWDKLDLKCGSGPFKPDGRADFKS